MAGRRPGAPDTRGEIVAAARTELAQRGYDGTSIRAVARRASVDPALVHHYFKDKQRLVQAALSLSADLVAVMEPVHAARPDAVGAAFVRALVVTWDDPANRESVIATTRSGLGSAEHGSVLTDLILRGPIAAVLERHRPDAPPSVPAMLLAQMIGLVVTRYLLAVEPVASMAVEQLVALVGPQVQQTLDLDVSVSPA